MSAGSPVPWPASGWGEVEVEGRALRLTNLDRVVWPQAGFTKREMLDYYARVAPGLLPHIRGRPLTLRRFPEGVDGLNWYQVQCRGRPEWMPVSVVRGQRGELLNYCVVNDLPALLWVANLGTVELHPFLGTADRPDEPTAVVFDLDPGPPAGLSEAAAVALWLRDFLDGLGLASFAKTSGFLGIHVYVPLNTSSTFQETKAFARAVAQLLTERYPEAVTDRMTRSLRRGKVLVDWLQNDPSRSTVAAWSLRAMPWPTVSTPVMWVEVEQAADGRHPRGLVFGPGTALDRLRRDGDVFSPVVEMRQELDPARVQSPR